MNHDFVALLGMSSSPATEDGAAAPGPGAFDMLLLLGPMFLIIYFLMLRPQQKKADTHKKLVEGLKKGDYVLAHAGFYGRVIDVEKRTVTLEVAPSVKIKLLKEAIAALDRPEEEASK